MLKTNNWILVVILFLIDDELVNGRYFCRHYQFEIWKFESTAKPQYQWLNSYIISSIIQKIVR